MKIEIELKDWLVPTLEMLRQATKWSMDETINRAIVTGLQTLNTQLEFAKIHNQNAKAGIEPNKEIQ